MVMRRRKSLAMAMACCSGDSRLISIDFDSEDINRITTYDGLESCILNSGSFFGNDSGTSRGGGDGRFEIDSFDEDESTCCSSSTTNAFGSFSSLHDAINKEDGPQHRAGRSSSHDTDDAMKEKFCKLLLGEDVTGGGTKGVSAALALSNAIVNLSATVFGELWKLEPLSDEKKRKWRTEMDWLLSPTNYMVELVPAKQSCSDGGILEVMTTKPRSDIQMNLPALKKLDSMLLESLDSMAEAEFWYADEGGGNRGEGSRRSAKWWFPSPQVPSAGLSDTERKRLLHHGRFMHQIFKAAKTINRNVLLEIPIPVAIKEALPKAGNMSLGGELYSAITTTDESEMMYRRLNLKSEHAALETMNKLEAVVSAWQRRASEEERQIDENKSPARTPWSFIRDPAVTETEKTESLVRRAETLVEQIKTKYPNLPPSFIDATKLRYCKDVGHSILEAYSRVLSNLAFSILIRIGDVLQRDIVSNPNSPAAMSHLVGERIPGLSDGPMLDRVRLSLVRRLNDA
ncbi:hypothetical protein M569_11093, partial [Genlisea aurea]